MMMMNKALRIFCCLESHVNPFNVISDFLTCKQFLCSYDWWVIYYLCFANVGKQVGSMNWLASL